MLLPVPCPEAAGPEDNAQVKTIQELARHFNLDGSVGPHWDPAGMLGKLFWEVGPGASWRIDIVVDDGLPPSILEVKDWKSGVGRTEADQQLVGYVTKTAALGLPVTRNTELNTRLWSATFLDRTGRPWCIWADDKRDGGGAPYPDPSAGDGVIYFARDWQTPPRIRARTPGCGDSDDDRRRARAEARRRAEALAPLATSLQQGLANLPPMMSPPTQGYQTDGSSNPVQAEVVLEAGRDPTITRTVEVDWGDGSTEAISVAPGSGSLTLTRTHLYPGAADHHYGYYVARARVLDCPFCPLPAAPSPEPALATGEEGQISVEGPSC